MGSSPKNSAERAAAKKALADLRLQHTHGVVHRDGSVTQHVVYPPDVLRGLDGRDRSIAHGIENVIYINGEIALTPRARARGDRLLQEVLEADGEGSKFELWRSVVHARRQRIRVTASPSDFYSPTIFRLRAEHAAGKNGSFGLVVVDGELKPIAELPADERRATIERILGGRASTKAPATALEQLEAAGQKKTRVRNAIVAAAKEPVA
jgi:hypothetical protein